MYPTLWYFADVALRVLCIPAAAAAGERVFSALGHIWSDNRARLLMGRAAMLTFVYFNARVIDRIHSPINQGDWTSFVEWIAEQPAEKDVVADVEEEDEVEILEATRERAGAKKKRGRPPAAPKAQQGTNKKSKAAATGNQDSEDDWPSSCESSDEE